MKNYFLSARALSWILGATLAGTFPAAAVIVPPGGLAATPSNHDLTLWFATTSPNLYTVQSSPDLLHWTNCQPGIPGNGTLNTVTMSNAIYGGPCFYRLLIQKPTSLTLPPSTAFSILGHSCGGIQEQVSAGFNPTNGYLTGVVDLSTSCGGSGRGGGYHTTKYTASVLVAWDLAGNVISAVSITNGVTVNPMIPTDGSGDSVYNIGSVAYLAVSVPGAPTGVTAIQSGDQFQVSWTLNRVNPAAVTSSTLTATPLNSAAPTLTATVSGPATTGIISTLEPQTTYQITVLDTTLGGSGPASAPINVTTVPATIPPSAPAGVTAQWQSPGADPGPNTLIATWQAAIPGNSPVDQYRITVTGSDGAGTLTNSVSGTTLSASFPVDSNFNWSVTVQAHNAAGWGPISTVAHLGGL